MVNENPFNLPASAEILKRNVEASNAGWSSKFPEYIVVWRSFLLQPPNHLVVIVFVSLSSYVYGVGIVAVDLDNIIGTSWITGALRESKCDINIQLLD